MERTGTLKLGQLCSRLGIPTRTARYLLEQGILPRGVDPEPERGNHRQLSLAQAYWLAVVLKLKEVGLAAPEAASVANLMESAINVMAPQLHQEPCFNPFRGLFETTARWYVDVGDGEYSRLLVETNPPAPTPLQPWIRVKLNRIELDATPVVIIRVDLTELARLLRGIEQDFGKKAFP